MPFYPTAVPGRIAVFTRVRELFSTLTRIIDCTRMRNVDCTLMRVQSTILSTDLLVIAFTDKEIILQNMNKQAGLSATLEIWVELGFVSNLIFQFLKQFDSKCILGFGINLIW